MITKGGIIKQLGMEDMTFDYALPQDWVDAVFQAIGILPTMSFVWLYDDKAPMFGRPFPLDARGWVIMALLPGHLKPLGKM